MQDSVSPSGDGPSQEERIIELETEVGDLRAACAYLHLALQESILLASDGQKAAFAQLFKSGDTEETYRIVQDRAKRLDDLMAQSKRLIWKEDGNGEQA